MTTLVTMLQQQSQLQLRQAPGHGVTQHMPNSSQTQMPAAVMASQWPLDRRLMQIRWRQQKVSRGQLMTQHSLQLQVAIRTGLTVLIHVQCSRPNPVPAPRGHLASHGCVGMCVLAVCCVLRALWLRGDFGMQGARESIAGWCCGRCARRSAGASGSAWRSGGPRRREGGRSRWQAVAAAGAGPGPLAGRGAPRERLRRAKGRKAQPSRARGGTGSGSSEPFAGRSDIDLDQ